MAISREIAGFSPSRADDLRKAVGKKDKVLMASLKDEFIEGCLASGTGQAGGRSACGACARRPATTRSTRATPPATRCSPTGPPTSRRTTRPSTWRRCSQLGHGHEGPGAVLRGGLHRHGPGGAAAGRQRERRRLRRDGGDGDPLRPDGGEGRRRHAVAAILAARDAGGPFETIWDFCRRVDQAQVNKRALESLVRSRRPRLHGRDAPRDARGHPGRRGGRRAAGATTSPPARSRCSAR